MYEELIQQYIELLNPFKDQKLFKILVDNYMKKYNKLNWIEQGEYTFHLLKRLKY